MRWCLHAEFRALYSEKGEKEKRGEREKGERERERRSRRRMWVNSEKNRRKKR